MHDSVRAMWRAFLDAEGRPPPPPGAPISAFHFGDNAADADECARLVVAGIKRATAPSVWEIEAAGEPFPQVGDEHVVTDWAGVAQCVIRTARVEVVPFDEVGPAFAAAEGEGDGSLAYWRRVHRAYYARVLRGTGYEVRRDMPVVCEHFEVVFPPSLAAGPT